VAEPGRDDRRARYAALTGFLDDLRYRRGRRGNDDQIRDKRQGLQIGRCCCSVDGLIFGIDHRDLTGKSTLLDVLEYQGPDRRRTPAPVHDGDAPWRKDPFEAKAGHYAA
jgi:hypothetical protein